MRDSAGGHSFSDDEPDISRAIPLHALVEGDCLALAVGSLIRLDLVRSLPLGVVVIGNAAQIPHPGIDESQRKLLTAVAFREQSGTNARHLPIVWARVNGHEDRRSEAGDEGEANGCRGESEDSFEGKRTQAYENHNEYEFLSSGRTRSPPVD